ncbi:MAG: Imm26 family immunity protein [Bacteroidota bacterium]
MSKNHPNKNFTTGTWFAIPLKSGGYAIGIITGGQSNIRLGYFFLDRFDDLPKSSDLKDLSASKSSLIAWFSAKGFKQGRWIVLESNRAFKRAEWPVPRFARVDVVDPTKGFIIEYDPNEPNHTQPLREILCSSQETENLPYDGLFGVGAIESKLDSTINL